MRINWIFPVCLLTGFLCGCGTVEEKEAKLLNSKAEKATVTKIVPPTFDEPAEPLRSIFLIECPKCKKRQFLVPLTIQTTGGTAVTNGTMTDRSLYFICSKRTCKNIITTHDQVLVEPVKAVRVR